MKNKIKRAAVSRIWVKTSNDQNIYLTILPRQNFENHDHYINTSQPVIHALRPDEDPRHSSSSDRFINLSGHARETDYKLRLYDIHKATKERYIILIIPIIKNILSCDLFSTKVLLVIIVKSLPSSHSYCCKSVHERHE